jgi:hypothetical protein
MTLALERLGRESQPVMRCFALGAVLERNLYEARIATVEAAEEMHGIGEVAP